MAFLRNNQTISYFKKITVLVNQTMESSPQCQELWQGEIKDDFCQGTELHLDWEGRHQIANVQ